MQTTNRVTLQGLYLDNPELVTSIIVNSVEEASKLFGSNMLELFSIKDSRLGYSVKKAA